MDPVVVSTVIARPREEVFDYLADVANHAEFLDHFMFEWRLTREESYGTGAGARFRVDAPIGSRFSWGDLTFAEVERPRRILARGRYGKYARVRMVEEWTLEPEGSSSTRVAVSFETEPGALSDRINELLLGRAFWRRRLNRGLGRLRSILEEDHGRGRRATIAGGARKPASAFRMPEA